MIQRLTSKVTDFLWGSPPKSVPPPPQVHTPGDRVDALPSGFRLVGGRLGIEIPGDQPLTLGRSQLGHPTVSRKHAMLKIEAGQVKIQDLGSTHGTLLNGQVLKPGQWYAVPSGARLSLAESELRLQGPTSSPLTSPLTAILSPQANIAGLNGAIGAIQGPLGPALRHGLQLGQLADLANRDRLESKESYLHSLQAARSQLAQESGIVDLPRGVPTLVLSDIHARRDFLLTALQHEVNGEKVFDLLKQGRLNLVCVGDGMHAEGRAAQRWLRAEQDMQEGRPSLAMTQEMIEGFGTMKMIMELKAESPDNFHFLRGNHDEIQGNFAKYARQIGEANMVQSWVKANLGSDFLQEYARFEESLPLVVRGQGFVASHAAPGGELQRTAIESRDSKAFAQLSWTENRKWDESDRPRFERNLREVGGEGSRWLVGHRPVDQGHYRSQFDGQLVQINAPHDFVVALVPADGSFDPDRDVFSLGRGGSP